MASPAGHQSTDAIISSVALLAGNRLEHGLGADLQLEYNGSRGHLLPASSDCGASPSTVAAG